MTQRILIAVAACSVLASCSISPSPTPTPRGGDDDASAATAVPAESGRVSDPELVARYDVLAERILETRREEVEVVRAILAETYRDAQAALGRAREAVRGADPATVRPALEELAILVGSLATEGDASVARVRKRLVEGGHHFNALTPSGGAAPGAHHGTEGSGAQPAPGPGQAHHAPGQAHHAPGQAHHAPGQAPGGATDTAQSDAGGAGDGTAPAQPSGGHHAGGQDPGSAGHSSPGHHGATDAHHRAESAHHDGSAPLLGYDSGYVLVDRRTKKTLLDASRALGRLAVSPSAEGLDAEWKKVQSACSSLGIGAE